MRIYLFILISLLGSINLLAQDTTQTPPPTEQIPSDVPATDAPPAQADRERPRKPEQLEKRRLFRGMIIVGLNASQIEGDRQSGFNKAGGNFGAGLQVNLPKNFSLGLEILYSMKGAKGSADDYKVNFFTRSITLDYIDIPILINYTLRSRKISNWSAMLTAGLIPDILVRQKDEYIISSPNGQGTSSSLGYRRASLDGTLGVTGIYKEHYALNVRWQYSLARANDIMYSPGNSYFNPYDGQLRHNIISVRAIYIF